MKYILMTLRIRSDAEAVTTSCNEQLPRQERKSLLNKMIQIHWQTVQQKVSLQIFGADHLSTEIVLFYSFKSYHGNNRDACSLNSSDDARSDDRKEVQCIVKNRHACVRNADRNLISRFCFVRPRNDASVNRTVRDVIVVNSGVRVRISDQNSREKRFSFNGNHKESLWWIDALCVFFFIKFLSEKLCKWSSTTWSRSWTKMKRAARSWQKMCIISLQDRADDRTRTATESSCSSRSMIRFIVSSETVRCKNRFFSCCE